MQGASARGLLPEADERSCGVRHGCGCPCSSTPFYGASGLEGADALLPGGRERRHDFCPASLLGSGPPDLQAGAPWVTRCQAPCSGIDGPWAGPPPCQELS